MEIKRAIIGRLSKPIKTGIVSNGKTLHKLYWNVLDEKICIIDNDVAIDINDFNNTYNLLKRDEYGRLDSNINYDDVYCLQVEPIKTKKHISSDDNGSIYTYEEEVPIKKEYKKYIKQYKKFSKN